MSQILEQIEKVTAVLHKQEKTIAAAKEQSASATAAGPNGSKEVRGAEGRRHEA